LKKNKKNLRSAVLLRNSLKTKEEQLPKEVIWKTQWAEENSQRILIDKFIREKKVLAQMRK
jgi:hypothetical protein